MQKMNLQKKRALRTALLVLLLSVAGIEKGYAYSFSAVCETGQTLYYNIIDATNHYVELTCPIYGWGDYARPIGDIILPESVFCGNTIYSVTEIGYRAFENCNGLTGNLTIPNSVTSIGKSAFRGCSGFTGSLTIGTSVTSIGESAFSGCMGITGSLIIPNSVTSIGDYAFKDCNGITGGLIIPNSVNTIGGGAFFRCASLTSITIGNSVTIIPAGGEVGTDGCFADCINLISVTFGNSVNIIGSSAFFGCTSLTSIVIPNSVSSIGHRAFAGCSSLSSITIPDSVTTIGCGTFDDCSNLTSITIPKSVTVIGGNGECEGCFVDGCTGLTNIHVEAGNPNFTSIDGVLFNSSKDEIITYPPGRLGGYVIPNSVTTIGRNAFVGRNNLTSITIPNSVTSIEGQAFSMCTGLTSITIPNSVVIIGGTAFWGCTGLTSIIIPNSVTTIINGGDVGGCFAFCTSLTTVTIGNSLTAIGSGTFVGCTSLTSVNIPNSVTKIGMEAFYGCTGLTSITIPNSVTDIGGSAFYGCTSLTSIEIPDSVLTIRYAAFMNCTSLSSVTIGNSVTSIGSKAFNGCTSLASITIPNSVTSIENEAFGGCTGLREVNFNAQNCSLNAGSVWQDSHDIMLNIGDGVTGLLGCAAWISVSIDDTVESISPNVCNGCDNLTTIIIGKSVKSIGSMAFANNPRLNMIYYNVEKDLEAPTNVFSNCPNLTTIHIGADVQEIGSNIFKGCNTVHFVVALGPTPAVLDVGAFSDIVDNSVLMVSCGKRVTYYSVWNMFPFNNIIEDCNEYLISIGVNGTGGNVTSSATNAQMGQTIIITITPNPGTTLSSISVVNANDPTQIIPITPMGKSASNYSFVMPPFEVVVMATFTTANTSVEENTVVSIPATVYPNPTTGFVKVESENIRRITISNMLGQIIYDGKAIGNEFEYDFSKHGAGLYLIRIETSSGIVVKKVSVR